MVNPLQYIRDTLGKVFFRQVPVEQVDESPSMGDITLVMGAKNPNNVNQAVRMRSKALGRALTHENILGTTNRSALGGFVKPIYDLSEVARAADVEPYVSQSIRKHREMILKEGYDIEGEDEEMVAYIRQRLFDFQMVTEIATEDWIREGLTNLVAYHNSGLVLRRDPTRSRGRFIKRYNKLLVPIAGVFVLDPTTLGVKVDKYGTIRRWEQRIEGGTNSSQRKTFSPEDVIWITIDKHTGFTFGTPYIVPVLDDVRALRRLEELALKMASKEVFPLYHYQVGTDDLPAEILDDGGDEVGQATSAVQNMPIGGTLVTSHRHNLTLVSKDGSALDLKPYLEYFESRVQAGLRLSDMDLGRGGTANRACYSGDTETLTDTGWKHYSDVNIDVDLIATVNPDTQKLEFHYAAEKLVYPYTGPMCRFQGPNTDVLVTPEHDMWVQVDDDWSKVKAESLEGTQVFQTAADWIDVSENLEEIDIPIATTEEEWLTLLAYFVQYGKVTPSKGEVKFIVRNNKNVTGSIKNLLDSAKMTYRYYDNLSYDKIAVNNYELAKHLTRYCSCRQYPKKIPDYVTITAVRSRAFLDGFSLASDQGLLEDTAILYSRSHTISGQLQEMVFKLGYSVTVLIDSSRDRIMVSNNSTDIASVTTEQYNGDVYCFNVPNHLFVTRRNGKIAIQGNTAGSLNQNVQDAAKDYQQAFSNQITNKLFLPLLLEGGFNVTHENKVKLVFPAIDREEMRSQQNHGQQLFLSNTIDRDEFRKDFLNKPPLTDEQNKKTTRQLDADVDEKLTRVSAEVTPNLAATGLSSTSKKATETANKSTGNRVRPANQSGSKIKSKKKSNDYKDDIDRLFAGLRSSVIALLAAGEDEVTEDQFVAAVNILTNNFKNDCFGLSRICLSACVADGSELALSSGDDDSEEDVFIDKRAIDKFIHSYSKKSLDICIGPYVEQICRYAQSDVAGNNSRCLIYGVLSSLHSSLRRLISDHIRTATRFGFARAARGMGYRSIHVGVEDGVRKTIEFQGSIMYRNLIPTLNEEDTLELGSKLIDDKESNV